MNLYKSKSVPHAASIAVRCKLLGSEHLRSELRLISSADSRQNGSKPLWKLEMWRIEKKFGGKPQTRRPFSRESQRFLGTKTVRKAAKGAVICPIRDSLRRPGPFLVLLQELEGREIDTPADNA